MKYKKIIAMAAGLAVLTVAGGSFAASAAESEASSKAGYSYTTGQIEGTKYADTDEQTDKTDYSYVAGQAKGAQYADAEGAADDADKTAFSFNTGKANGTQYAPEDDTEKSADKTDYSFNAGQQNAQSRNEIYTALPEGGTKEDAEAFYEHNDVGGGAWADGAYDESAKADYGYAKGQKRGSSYAQETDGKATPDKSGYIYSTAKKSYEQNHAAWNWGE
ncbi:hypothetical protein [Ruminococcus flavefaciens]|uniref:hypothetical protein n=1 Tax=Ruminococcus flavefaciens TaxID=1265 RepID=UPI0026F05556|nr:hypothetical protein [Ruminococcus flavefaciens]